MAVVTHLVVDVLNSMICAIERREEEEEAAFFEVNSGQRRNDHIERVMDGGQATARSFACWVRPCKREWQ